MSHAGILRVLPEQIVEQGGAGRTLAEFEVQLGNGERVETKEYVYTHHADIERKADELTFAQVEEALLNGEILEQYPDTGRGESCLIVGFAKDVPIHVVCGWRGEKVALITVYIPCPPKFVDPWTRGGKSDEESSV
jgi:hypothetical protein